MKKDELFAAELPLLPAEFESLIIKQCWSTRDVLSKKCVHSHIYSFHSIIIIMNIGMFQVDS